MFNSGGCPCTDDAPFFGNAPVIDLYIVQTIFPPVFAGANDQPWIFHVGWKLRVKLPCKIATLCWGNVIRNVVQDFSREHSVIFEVAGIAVFISAWSCSFGKCPWVISSLKTARKRILGPVYCLQNFARVCNALFPCRW